MYVLCIIYAIHIIKQVPGNMCWAVLCIITQKKKKKKSGFTVHRIEWTEANLLEILHLKKGVINKNQSKVGQTFIVEKLTRFWDHNKRDESKEKKIKYLPFSPGVEIFPKERKGTSTRIPRGGKDEREMKERGKKKDRVKPHMSKVTIFYSQNEFWIEILHCEQKVSGLWM